jgi:hypothetical protein
MHGRDGVTPKRQFRVYRSSNPLCRPTPKLGGICALPSALPQQDRPHRAIASVASRRDDAIARSAKISRRGVSTMVLAAIGLFAWSKPAVADPFRLLSAASAASARAQTATCGASHSGDIEYLVFWPPLPGTGFFSSGIEDFVGRLGTTGDGRTRQLGIGERIPVWVRVGDEARIVQAIRAGFDRARRTNTAVFFVVDDHNGWDERSDLWNWYDPAKRGYNPQNSRNVEWYNWEGLANRRRYISPEGRPSQSPHICYNSPTIQQEIGRLVSQVIGPALREEIDKLRQQGRDYLFAGIMIGAETGIDDYSIVAKAGQIQRPANPEQAQMLTMLRQAATLMDEDRAPRDRLGYCALTNAGYSRANPPADINRALADINRWYIAAWGKYFADAGLPCSRIYTHVAASPPQDGNNAPIDIVFNPYSRPGWTTYPLGTLANGFRPLYAELSRHGNPAWGGVEANTAAFARPNSPGWEEYLAWHYNYGAKLVGINVGAADRSVMENLQKGAFGEEAMAAYRKFLQGGRLMAR